MTDAKKPETLANSIEIFRPGTFTPMSGGEVTFSEEDVSAIASSYDSALHDPPLSQGTKT